MTTTDTEPGIVAAIRRALEDCEPVSEDEAGRLLDAYDDMVNQRDAEAAARRVLRDESTALRHVLADRERELLDLKGPCSNTRCRLHYAHSGPCDITGAEASR